MKPTHTSQAARAVSVSALGAAASIAGAPMSVDPLCLPARGATALASAVALPDATAVHVQVVSRSLLKLGWCVSVAHKNGSTC